jgi:hypothetical protein
MWVSLWDNVWCASVEPVRGAIYDTRLNRLGPSPCLMLTTSLKLSDCLRDVLLAFEAELINLKCKFATNGAHTLQRDTADKDDPTHEPGGPLNRLTHLNSFKIGIGFAQQHG